jgi:hypothetical protein
VGVGECESLNRFDTCADFDSWACVSGASICVNELDVLHVVGSDG